MREFEPHSSQYTFFWEVLGLARHAVCGCAVCGLFFWSLASSMDGLLGVGDGVWHTFLERSFAWLMENCCGTSIESFLF
jgi:hypothetical protein